MTSLENTIRNLNEINDTLLESDYTLYHKDYSSAVQHARKKAVERGYRIDNDDWDRKVAMGPKKPSEGRTNSFSIQLTKNGKPVKNKALQLQVYNKGGPNPYELNMYIEQVDPNAELIDEAKKEKKLDPVGKSDGDIDNDGDIDKSDEYLKNRRKEISKNVKADKKKDKIKSISGKHEKIELDPKEMKESVSPEAKALIKDVDAIIRMGIDKMAVEVRTLRKGSDKADYMAAFTHYVKCKREISKLLASKK
jgi:hypothetical protein